MRKQDLIAGRPARPRRAKKPPPWFVYLLRCGDGSLYCGIATDVARRVAEHNGGKGAKYIVPARRPVECVWKQGTGSRSAASRLEYRMKRLAAAAKEEFVRSGANLPSRRGDKA